MPYNQKIVLQTDHFASGIPASRDVFKVYTI